MLIWNELLCIVDKLVCTIFSILKHEVLFSASAGLKMYF